MEHEISALYDVAHGAGLATVVPSWMRYVYKTDVARFARFAQNVFGVSKTAPDGTPRDDEALALAGIDALETFWRMLGLPTTMRELGIPDDSRFEEMARKAVLARSNDGKEIPQGNFRKLYSSDILAIYKMADS
jgi:alcohol dehydrogenase YqhD (iron-dependent ADH family)